VPPGRTRAHSVTRQPSRSSLAGPSNGSPPHIISPQVQVPLRVRLARTEHGQQTAHLFDLPRPGRQLPRVVFIRQAVTCVSQFYSVSLQAKLYI